jgi:O-antigen/teichoic acid export membrane protein
MNELKKNKLLSNSIFSGASFFISILIRLITMPYVFNHLNINEYGILALITNILAYFSFFDLGVGRSIIKFLSENNLKNDIEEFNKYLSTGIIFYLIIGILSAILLCLNTSTIVVSFFKIPKEFHKIAISCLIISGFNFLIVIQNQLLVSIPEAFNRFDISKLFQIVSNILSSIITLLIVYFGYGLTEIVYFNVFFGILTLYINYEILKRLVPKVKFIYKIDMQILKKMLKFGLIVMLGNIVFTGYTLFDLTFIGSIIGASALAYYSVSSTASRYLHGVVGSILLPIFPLASEHSASNKLNFENIYYSANKFSIILSVYLCLILCLLSKDILNIWMGQNFTKNAQLSFVLLVISWAIFSFTIVTFQTTEGFGFPKFNLYFALSCTISSILLYKILIPKFGIDGAALSRLISIIIVAPLYIGFVERKIFKENKIKFWTKTLLMTTLSSLAVFLSIIYIQKMYKPNLFRFAFLFFFISISYPLLLFKLGMFNSYEKGQIKKVLSKFSTIKQKKNEDN